MNIDSVIIGYKNEELCKACGGDCCKNAPGAFLPDDLVELTAETIIDMLKTGRYAIDWWEGDPREDESGIDSEIDYAYYLRPAVAGQEGKPTDPSWGGKCTFLTKTGCELPFDKRPAGCRLLEPNKNKKCVAHGATKKEAAIAWIPYHEIILKALEEV